MGLIARSWVEVCSSKEAVKCTKPNQAPAVQHAGPLGSTAILRLSWYGSSEVNRLSVYLDMVEQSSIKQRSFHPLEKKMPIITEYDY